MINSLRSRATNGFLWSAFDRLLAQGSQLFFNIILARLLMPDDFGLIGLLSIFIVISQSFIESGMGSGLIQKKDRVDLDYSTVFIFNFCVSLFFYLLLYIFSPLIADFFERGDLVLLIRILGLTIIINSLAIVHRSILTINLDFKTFAKVNTIAILISGSVTLVLAYIGFGVWALVVQNLLMTTISVILLWSFCNWTISFKFSYQSFRQLFSYGSKLLVTSLYSTSLNEIFNVSIGKIYSAQVLGYYTNAKKLTDASSETITSILQQVSFPILASLQYDRDKLLEIYIKLIRITSFFIFPFMTLFAMLADPFIKLLLTDKWAATIPLLQLLCFARIVTPISVVNLNILKAVGRSDLFLKVDLVKLPIIILILIITIPLSVKAMVIGSVIVSIISFFINAYMPGKLFGYGAISQLKDITPMFFATFSMAILVFFTNMFFESNIFKLFFGLLTGLTTYIATSYFLKIPELEDTKVVFKNIVTKYYNK